MDAGRARVYEAAGYFLSILGMLVLGISLGLGFGTYLTRNRFRCGWGLGETSAGLLNVTQACGDVLGAANPMIVASAAGGTVAFMCGLGVMVYIKREGLGAE